MENETPTTIIPEPSNRNIFNITPIQDCQQEYSLEEEERILAMVMTKDNYKPERIRK